MGTGRSETTRYFWFDEDTGTCLGSSDDFVTACTIARGLAHEGWSEGRNRPMRVTDAAGAVRKRFAPGDDTNDAVDPAALPVRTPASREALVALAAANAQLTVELRLRAAGVPADHHFVRYALLVDATDGTVHAWSRDADAIRARAAESSDRIVEYTGPTGT